MTEQSTNYARVDQNYRKQIRHLNDLLRTTGRGGMIQISNGIASLDVETVASIFDGIGRFENFTSENDPWGEHDCAVVRARDLTVIWKIDYFDKALAMHSPDPANPMLTTRVLTVMLADEY